MLYRLTKLQLFFVIIVLVSVLAFGESQKDWMTNRGLPKWKTGDWWIVSSDILIDELNNGVYYARMCVSMDGRQFEIDARPSDCIAIALRARAPVHVRESVLSETQITKEELEGILTLDSYLS